MKTLLLLLTFGSAIAVRLSRMLGLVQQKEYRLDRLWLFFTSLAGKQEFWRILPQRQDFSRTGFKRPKFTPRIILVCLVTLALTGFYAWTMSLLVGEVQSLLGQVLLLLLAALLYLVALPLFVLLSVLPTVLAAQVLTYVELVTARAKVSQHSPVLIGITGSYGKTATKQLLTHFLSQKYSVFMTPRSYNTRYSVARSIRTGYTGQEVMVLEYGAYGVGEIAAIAKWFKPELILLTGLAKQHLGLFSNLEGIIEAKAELVANMSVNGKIYYNDSDPGVQKIIAKGDPNNLRQHIPASKTVISGKIGAPALTKTGQMVVGWNKQKVTTQLVGTHYISSIRLAASVADELGVSEVQVKMALESFRPSTNFIRQYQLRSGAVVIDDGGTSNPAGFKAALEIAQKLGAAHRVLVTPGIVDLGVESDQIHLELAGAAQAVVDQVWHVGENGREQFSQVFANSYIDSQASIRQLLDRMPPDGLLLLEGRMPGWFMAELKKQIGTTH